jgi:ligand-binding sensor domain-containing protein
MSKVTLNMLLSLILYLYSSTELFSQNPQWINYTNGQTINAIAIEGDLVWIGTNGGLVRIDQNTEEITYFNRANSGLPYNVVNCIAIDSFGNKWMGTNADYLLDGHGLVKYDNTNWTVFNTSNSGISHNNVNCIAIDSAGNKWIGSHRRLVKFDDTNWTVYDSYNSGLPDDNVSCITINHADTLWIGFDGYGLAKFDGSNWTRYTGSNSGLPGRYTNIITSICIDHTGNKWIGTGGGLAKFNGTNWTIYDKSNSGLIHDFISSMALDKSGNLWLGNDGLIKFDRSNWTLYNSSNSALPNDIVNCITIDRYGNKWVGTDYGVPERNEGGLVKFNDITWTYYPTSNSGLPLNNIDCIAIDSYGNKWIGSYYYWGFGGYHAGFGLTKYNGNYWSVYNIENSGIPTNSIECIVVDSDQNLWLGSARDHEFFNSGYGLIHYDGLNWTIFDTSNSDIPGNYVNCISIDESGIKWLGVNSDDFGQGLVKFNGYTWTVYDSSNSPLPSHFINCLAIDDSGTIWIGTSPEWDYGPDSSWQISTGGLATFDGTIWTIYTPDNSGLPSSCVYQIAIDDSGNKWIGTDEGLAKYDGSQWTVFDEANSGLEDIFVVDIAFDHSGNKWIGTRAGLAKYDGSNWFVYNESNSGLSDNWINCISIDKSNNMWIGTRGGLSVFNENGIPVSINEDFLSPETIPNIFSLSQNYPNPFNPLTTIEFTLPKPEHVTLEVFNLIGQSIMTVLDQNMVGGRHQVIFDGRHLASGAYYYQLIAGEYREVKKMILLR